jgi:PBSX family phage portal protein
MAKHKRHMRARGNAPAPASPAPIEAFSFGEPEPIDRSSLLDYADVWQNGRWYEPPVSQTGLANMMQMAPHHSSAIYIKRNLLVASFEPTPYLNAAEFAAFTTDFVTFGNAYLEGLLAMSGRLQRCRRSPAMYTRRGVEDGQFWFLPRQGTEHEFKAGSVCQVKDDDVKQEIYGIPEYLSALHAAQLNRSATLFRRKYYDNGSHAGFILYMTDPAQSVADVDAMRTALKDSKGPGNFRNLFMYSPNGKKDGIQLIPISEVAAKDDFAAIKNVSRDDLLAAHRVPPQLLGVIPMNAGGFGDVEKATRMFIRNEIVPLQVRLQSVNDQFGVEVIRFKPLDGTSVSVA